ncbi:MAG: MBL fold metallo-hydrolase [Patescibacteria group bacterium]|nr:MBL fold metallo-hydrolase [Patescibacteria group bacterium]
MKILRYSLGQLQANCYFLIKENNCLIIDPADEANFILEELQRKKLKLLAMLATHGHFDHLMAVGEIQKSFNVPLYISFKDKFLINRLEKTAEYFLGYKPIILPIKKIKDLDIKNSLKIENYKLKIINTPGHTPGSVCFYFSEEKVIFTGDTLFKGAIGRDDFSYSNKNDLRKSLEQILSLPKETIIYSGHGEETVIFQEKNILNQFYF